MIWAWLFAIFLQHAIFQTFLLLSAGPFEQVEASLKGAHCEVSPWMSSCVLRHPSSGRSVRKTEDLRLPSSTRQTEVGSRLPDFRTNGCRRTVLRTPPPRVPRVPQVARVPRVPRVPRVSGAPRVARIPRLPDPPGPRVLPGFLGLPCPRGRPGSRVPRVPRVPRLPGLPGKSCPCRHQTSPRRPRGHPQAGALGGTLAKQRVCRDTKKS